MKPSTNTAVKNLRLQSPRRKPFLLYEKVISPDAWHAHAMQSIIENQTSALSLLIMKSGIPSLALTVIILTAFLSPGFAKNPEEYRAWTNNKGQTIQAALVTSNNTTVSLKMRNGREHQVSILDLSDADIEYIKNWESNQAKNKKLASQEKPQTETIMTVAGEILFSDKLDKIDGEWRHNIGDWKNIDGVLFGAEKPSDDHGAVFKRKFAFQNAIIEFSFKLDGTKGISLSIDDDEDHVCRLSINEAGFTVQKDDHDHEGPDERVQFERRNAEISSGEWHIARIEILGNEMLGQIDDEIGFGAHELIATGKTKFGFTVGGQSAQFKDLKIWEALPNENWEKAKRRLERKRK